MTHEELVTQITRIADAAREEGQYVEINDVLPTVLIYRGEDDEFFFQEHEAVDLLQTVPDYVNVEDYLLYIAQEW